MTGLVERVERLGVKAKARNAERKAQLREQFPADAAWIDSLRAAFPGCRFRNWTIDGERL